MNPRLRQLIRRALTLRKTSIRDYCEDRHVICDSQTQLARPALYLPGELERVKDVMSETTFDQEKARIAGGDVTHAATIAYVLRDVELDRGFLYKGSARDRLVRAKDVPVRTAGCERIESASLASSLHGSTYFGHWLVDDLTRHLVAETTGHPVVAARRPYGHEPEYCRMLGIVRTSVARARFDRLVIFDDYGQNDDKRRRYHVLRDRLRQAVPGAGHESVFLRRGTGGEARSLVNEAEIIRALSARGFVILDPENLTVSELVGQLLGAKLVAGVEGSHLTHAILTMAEGGMLCVLQPPYRFNNWCKDLTDCVGMDYSFTVGTEVDGGFEIDVSRLERLLDRIAKG